LVRDVMLFGPMPCEIVFDHVTVKIAGPALWRRVVSGATCNTATPAVPGIYWTAMVTGFDCDVAPVCGSATVITTGMATPGVTPDGT